MTIPSTNRRTDTVGNDSTPNAAYGFRIQVATDLAVYFYDATTLIQTKLLVSDYTFNGPVNQDSGGTITITNATYLNGSGNIDTGNIVTILGGRAAQQGTSYRNNAGYFPERHENSYDSNTILIQQLTEQISRAILFEETTQGASLRIDGTLSDGDILQYDATKGKFESVQLTSGTLAAPAITVPGNLASWGNGVGTQLSDSGVAAATVTANTAAAAAAQADANTNTGLLAGVQLDGASAGNNVLADNGTYIPKGIANLVEDTSPQLGGNLETNSFGIAFPATAVPIANVNTLDDYEEGTWTPTVQDDSQSDGEGQTYTDQTGTYQKVGNTVHFQCNVEVSSMGTLNGLNGFRIAGLPFASHSGGNYHEGAPIGLANGLAIIAGNAAAAYVAPGGTRIFFQKWSAVTGTTELTITEAGLPHFILSGTYQTD